MTAALNVHAHIPVVPQEGQYRMGAGLTQDSDDLWFNTTLPDGTVIACDEPDGWEGVTFLTPIDQAGGRDGGLVGPQSVAPRDLPVKGAIVSPDPATLRNVIRAMRAKLGPRKVVIWDQFDFGVGVRMGLVCRAQNDFRAVVVPGGQRGGVAATFSFSLVAANPPWKYATGSASTACTQLPASAVSGRTYNLTYPWNYGVTTNPGGTLNVVNAGDIDAWPVIEVTGPVDTAIISNDSTGEEFAIIGTIPAGSTVTVDGRTGVVMPSSYRLAGRPFALRPGVNSIRWRALSGSFTPDALMCFTWRSTWE